MKCMTKLILLLTIVNLSCKNANKNLSNDQLNTTNLDSTENLIGKKLNVAETPVQEKKNQKSQKWFFYKVSPLSDLSNCEDSKYKDFNFSISGDSIFIDNIYTDNVYRETVKAEKFFRAKYELNLYKTFLPKNFNVKLPATFEYIRNKRAYQKESPLEAYFQDAFFIEQYLFFNKDGCLYCFKNEENNDQTVAESCLNSTIEKLPYSKIINPKKVQYNQLKCQISGTEKYLCGEKFLRYVSLPDFKKVKLILVPLDCGDFEYRFYLLTILKNKVISNQYVEGEWFEPESISKKEITSFSIDKNYKITITTNNIQNGKTSLKDEQNFEVEENGVLKRL